MAMEDMPSVSDSPSQQQLALAKMLMRGSQDPAQTANDLQMKRDTWAALNKNNPNGQRDFVGSGQLDGQIALADQLMQPTAGQHSSVGGAIGAGIGDILGTIGGGISGKLLRNRQADARLNYRNAEDDAQAKLIDLLLNGGRAAPGGTTSAGGDGTPELLRAADPNRPFYTLPGGG